MKEVASSKVMETYDDCNKEGPYLGPGDNVFKKLYCYRKIERNGRIGIKSSEDTKS
jgi:hypothetical protein